MIFKCPTCRRKNDISATNCLRCNMDLTMLGKIIRHADHVNKQGLVALCNRQFTIAIKYFKSSYKLYHNQQVAQNLAFAKFHKKMSKDNS